MPRKPKSPRRRPIAAELDAEANTLLRLAADKKLISGVYNYCDRWCERCPLTARCLVFKTERARDAKRGRARPDLANQAFWDELGNSFAVAMHMVMRDAKKLGINLDDAGERAAVEVEERQRRRLAARQGSALHRAASVYWKSARKLLERLTPELTATEAALNTQLRLGAGRPEAVAAEIRDALEVVQWYLFFIDVKLQRAVSSRVDSQREGDDGHPNDADGSAKVALIAIDRTIGAWARLRERLEGEADAMLDLLVQLERLRRATEREFPQARAFKRPGFDEVLPARTS